MLNAILDLFKENGLVAVVAAAVTALYFSLFKGDSPTPASWRKVAIATTITSMILGLYWVPAQSVWYLVLGLGIVFTSCVFNAREITYPKGTGFAVQTGQLTRASRIAAFLPAVWAPFAIPSLQWFLHRTIHDLISAPGSANPMLHLSKSMAASLAVTGVLIASTFFVDRVRMQENAR